MDHRNDLILTNANLVSMEPSSGGYKVSPNKTIIIKQGQIDQILDELPDNTQDCQIHDCQNKLLTPGFIDCHTHLVFAGNRAQEFEQRLNGVSYTEIAKQGGGILSTVTATRTASEEQLIELALPRLDGLLKTGVTSVEIKSGYGLTFNDEIKMLKAAKALEQQRKVKVSATLLAAHAVPPEYKNDPDSYIDVVCQEIIPHVAELKLASAIDVFCESIGFSLKQTEKVFQAAKRYGIAVKAHAEQLSELGGSELVAQYGGLSADHIEYLTEQGARAMGKANTVATLLPGAFYFLKETQQPPIAVLRKHNVPMAIATDFNPGTSPFADLTMMMNMGCTLFGLTPEEALRGVTCHAAQALGFSASRGQIKQGFEADIAIWNSEHPADLSYQVGIPRLSARVVNGELCNG
ncbi:imidazolonepropionase [Vibrio profundum]|uniref:imidazolonepropionase n=1 Tax=Vibrio profundum TaxID=2910247 RepID=UPI003D146FEA